MDLVGGGFLRAARAVEQVKALIARYGAEKLSAVKEEDYPAIMKDLEAIV